MLKAEKLFHIMEDKYGNVVSIMLFEEKGEHIIEINGTEWLRAKDYGRAVILYKMLIEHITEYTSLI